MSASNWAVCPRCLDQAKQESAVRVQAAVEAYGKVSSDEYERLREETAQPEASADQFVTFREDYEIYGAEDGTIKVSYGGHCSKCGLGLDFNEDHPFYGEASNG